MSRHDIDAASVSQPSLAVTVEVTAVRPDGVWFEVCRRGGMRLVVTRGRQGQVERINLLPDEDIPFEERNDTPNFRREK